MNNTESRKPKYPDVRVTLVGDDGNPFSILARTAKALRRAGVPQDEINAMSREATSGSYEHLIQTVIEWVETD